MSKTLLQISDDAQALFDLLEESEGDISDAVTEAAIDQWLAETEGNLKAKLDGYAALIREYEHRAKARKAEATWLHERARVDLNNAERLRERLKWFFESHGLRSVKGERYTLTLQANGGLRPLLLKLPAEQLPEEFQEREVIIKADTRQICALLDAGEELAFAELGERGTTIRVK